MSGFRCPETSSPKPRALTRVLLRLRLRAPCSSAARTQASGGKPGTWNGTSPFRPCLAVLDGRDARRPVDPRESGTTTADELEVD